MTHVLHLFFWGMLVYLFTLHYYKKRLETFKIEGEG